MNLLTCIAISICTILVEVVGIIIRNVFPSVIIITPGLLLLLTSKVLRFHNQTI